MGNAEMGRPIGCRMVLARIKARELLFPVMGERLHRGQRRGPGRRAGKSELNESRAKR